MDGSSPAPKQPQNGVFWVIDGKLHAYPFSEGYRRGVAKSGDTYNHKALWEVLAIDGKPYNHYPRGRVCMNRRGGATIYLHPAINTPEVITQIKKSFGLETVDCRVIKDHSEHYKCYTDAKRRKATNKRRHRHRQDITR